MLGFDTADLDDLELGFIIELTIKPPGCFSRTTPKDIISQLFDVGADIRDEEHLVHFYVLGCLIEQTLKFSYRLR